MEVKVEDVSTTKKKITLEIESDRVDKVIDATYRKLGKKANLKGFRPGKVPQAVLEKVYVGKMTEDATRELINQNYVRALLNQDFTAVGEPEIKDMGELERGKPFSFSLEVEVKPEIEAVGYTGLELKKEKLQIDDQVISQQLEEIRKDKAETREAEREVAADGDQVIIDFEGFRDGEPIAHGRAEDYRLELGSRSLIPGFEEQVVGMKKGEEKEIGVTFPEGYVNQEMAGQKAQFKVLLKSIQEKVPPPLDDEFAKKFGVETIGEFRDKIARIYR